MEDLEQYKNTLATINFRSTEWKMRLLAIEAGMKACNDSPVHAELYCAYAKGDAISVSEAKRRAACITCQGSSDCGDCVNQEKGK